MFHYYGKTALVAIKSTEMEVLTYPVCIKVWKLWKSFPMEKAHMCTRRLTAVIGKHEL